MAELLVELKRGQCVYSSKYPWNKIAFETTATVQHTYVGRSVGEGTHPSSSTPTAIAAAISYCSTVA